MRSAAGADTPNGAVSGDSQAPNPMPEVYKGAIEEAMMARATMKQPKAARVTDSEVEREERKARTFVPGRTTHCACCLSLIDPSSEILAANPDLSDDCGNLYCNARCKRIYKAGDSAAIEAHRREVKAGGIDAFAHYDLRTPASVSI